jgi:hypothetical protein
MAKGRKKTVKEKVEETETTLQNLDTKEVNVQKEEKNEHLFSIDVSNYGIKKDEAEKLVNTALKFYFENKDKSFVEPKIEDELEQEVKEPSDLVGMINDYEKSLKLFNYVPKNKVLSFLKTLKENLL